MANAPTQAADLAAVFSTTDASTKLTPEETNGRKFVRRCIDSPKQPNFFEHVKNTLYAAAPTLDYSDEARILEDLFERNMYAFVDAFEGKRSRPAYLEWVADWVSRTAKLTELAKSMLPALEELCSTHPAVARRVLYNLDQYPGPVDFDPLFAWASTWALEAEMHTIIFVDWYSQPELQQAVKAGVWDILRSCSDLGFSEELVTALISDAWLTIAEMMAELTQPSDVPLAKRLRGRARFTARTWKDERLAERGKFIGEEEYNRLAELDMLGDESPFTLSILTYAKDAPALTPEQAHELQVRVRAGEERGGLAREYGISLRTLNQYAPVDVVPKPTIVRRCGKCNAVLSSRNESKDPICIPCWESEREQGLTAA